MDSVWRSGSVFPLWFEDHTGGGADAGEAAAGDAVGVYSVVLQPYSHQGGVCLHPWLTQAILWDAPGTGTTAQRPDHHPQPSL